MHGTTRADGSSHWSPKPFADTSFGSVQYADNDFTAFEDIRDFSFNLTDNHPSNFFAGIQCWSRLDGFWNEFHIYDLYVE